MNELELPRFQTQRLLLRPAEESDVPEILDFFTRNQAHLGPTDPIRPEGFFTPEFWRRQILKNLEDLQAGRSLRTFLFLGPDFRRVVGTANLSEIIRGAFHSCFLGFSLDGAEQGKGLMTEGLRALISCAFDELNLHRISANHMPHNRKSAAVLRRLGFVPEGYARDYLMIAGRWEDHVLTSLLNDRWRKS
ncbi:MAG: GNAT family N-acetyltransferase [Candidatus Wallbacteria bacterium]|nr:GNAT family N-acetyltransferase [Candidatus Wallbacteria bacterium]